MRRVTDTGVVSKHTNDSCLRTGERNPETWVIVCSNRRHIDWTVMHILENNKEVVYWAFKVYFPATEKKTLKRWFKTFLNQIMAWNELTILYISISTHRFTVGRINVLNHSPIDHRAPNTEFQELCILESWNELTNNIHYRWCKLIILDIDPPEWARTAYSVTWIWMNPVRSFVLFPSGLVFCDEHLFVNLLLKKMISKRKSDATRQSKLFSQTSSFHHIIC